LNEEKLCQLLANQTRALQKRQPQAASHVHHLQIRLPQRQAFLRVPETAAQVQTSSHAKMVAEVVQNSAQLQPMLLARHAQRVHSSRLVHLRLMAHAMSVRHMATAMTVLLARTAAATRVAQNVQAMATAMIVHHVATVQLMATATTQVVQSVRLTIAMIVHHVVTVQLTETATTEVVRSVQTMVVEIGRQEATKVQVVQLKRLGVHAMIAMRARLTAIAMTAALVTHVLLTATAMQIARHVLLVTAKTVQHVQVLVVASATATVQSVLHTASLILHASKTALQSAVGRKTVVATQVAKSATRKVATAGFPRARAIMMPETPIAQTVQHAMIHASQLSVAHATQTLIRRLSSKTRSLSV
jgi:hypothetical protein